VLNASIHLHSAREISRSSYLTLDSGLQSCYASNAKKTGGSVLALLPVVLYLIFPLLCLGIIWFFQRSAMFSALKKYEIWKNKETNIQK
jgi:hypothetical protein